MTPAALFVILVIIVVFAILMFTRVSPDIVLLGAMLLFLVTGVVDPVKTLRGFSNEGVVTVGILFVVAAGLRESGAVFYLVRGLMGMSRTVLVAQTRVLFPTAAISAFLNNTPLVAMLIPAITDWSRRNGIAASKLLIPLSYAAMLGGIWSLFGTSTNLVVHGLVNNQIEAGILPASDRLQVFTISPIGIPVGLIGLLFLLFVGRKLLPDRRPALAADADPRQYAMELEVQVGSPYVGKTIESAGLRNLEGVYLMEIDRKGRVLPAVGPEEVLEAGDHLVFVGSVEGMADLRTWPGLQPATNQIFKLTSSDNQRTLIEAVVSNTSPFVGQTIREGRFRTTYNAAVIAVARNGERIGGRIGDIRLRAGDTLLLEAHPSFLDTQRTNRDFFLVSRLQDFTPPKKHHPWLAGAILIAMIIYATAANDMLTAAGVAAAALLVTGCISVDAARRSIDWSVLLAVVGAFALGDALNITGAAQFIADQVLSLAMNDPWLSLAAIYFMTWVFTEILTNNAAAILVFPIAHSAATNLGVDFTPFILAIMIAASASFSTPIGYQTNLMVYGPGGYRFMDFVKIGVPLSIVVGIATVVLLPFLFPF